MINKRILIEFFTTIFILSLINPVIVKAQESIPTSEGVNWKLTDLVGEDILRLEGYRPSIKFNLVLPTGWEPSSDGKLSLEYRISDLVTSEAVLAVQLNDQTQASTKFRNDSGTLEFDLSESFFQSGENLIELQAFLPLEEVQDCIVPHHPARWLEFDSSSLISLPLKITETALILADFPAQFEAMGNEPDEQITFVIPDEPKQEELNALSAVVFALQRETTTNPHWAIISSSNFSPENLAGPAILIGAEGYNPYIDQLVPVRLHDAGWLNISRPDWSGGHIVLVVSGPDASDVLLASDALVDPWAKFQMNEEIAIIETLPTIQPTIPNSQFTFGELGYSERVVTGEGEQSLIYSFDLPLDWSMEDGLLEIHFAHSAIINPQVANLKVLLNGNTVTDILLDAPESASNIVEVNIPKNHLRPGRNFLRLAFDFGLSIEFCDTAYTYGPWASVRPDTSLTLPHADNGNRIDLDDFPYLFNSQTDLANLTLILPERSELYELARTLEIVRTLSLPNNRSPFAPRWIRPADFDEDTKLSHLIVLGDPPNQPLLKMLNPHLPVQFDLENGNLIPTYGIRLPIKSANLGVIQIIRSPWADNLVVIVVTGTSVEGYQSAINLLTDPNLQPELEGQVAVISSVSPDKLPQIYTQNIADVGAIPVINRLDSYISVIFGPNSTGKTMILILAGLLIAIIMALLWKRFRRRSSPDTH